MNIEKLWKALEQGKIINWHNISYRVIKRPITKGISYQENHFSHKKGYVLVILHDEGHQCLISESELKDLYIKED